MNVHMLKRMPDVVLLGIFLVLAAAMFTLTNPRHVPPAVLAVGFFVLFGIVYTSLRIAGRLTGLHERLKPFQYKALTLEAAALPIILLALQSLGQLTLRDALILLVLFVGAYFYLSRQQT